MHPAPSLVLFTSLSGLGLGLGFWTGVGAVGREAVLVAAAIAVLLTGGGLLASVFHLRRPARAIYALSQWRSSWLSREGILAPLASALLVLHAGGTVLATPMPPVGWLAAAASLLAVFATAMIYAQLRAVPAWHGWLTPVVFLAFATAGGALLAAAIAAGAGSDPHSLLLAAIPLQVVAWTAKLRYWRRAALGAGATDMASATGLGGRGAIRLLEPPHTGSNYLLSEMSFRVARRHANRLRSLALAFGASAVGVSAIWGIWGAAADAPAALAASTLAAATLLHLFGVGLARWLFYAEATHTVALYYGRGDPPVDS